MLKDSPRTEPTPSLGGLLRAEFEELAEALGEKLLPVLRDITEALQYMLENPLPALLGPIGLLADSIQDVGENLNEAEADLRPFAQAMIDLGVATAEDAMPAIEAFIPFLFQTGDAAEDATKDVVRFAHMSKKELKDWQDDIGESFDSVIFDLDNMAHKADVTRREFIKAHEAMEDRARELSRAMKELRGERWVNDDYIKFLSEQGPDWLIGFTKLTKEQQREAQQAWEDSARATDNAKGSLDKIIKALDDMAGTTTKHKVEIHYEYVGYDPSKPGMGQQR